jgi:hypothetical protein
MKENFLKNTETIVISFSADSHLWQKNAMIFADSEPGMNEPTVGP